MGMHGGSALERVSSSWGGGMEAHHIDMALISKAAHLELSFSAAVHVVT